MKRTFLLITLLILVGSGVALASMELTSARVYKNQREWGKALQFYNQTLQKEPDNLEAYEERGEVEQILAAANDDATIAILKQSVTDKDHAQIEMYRRMVADFKQGTTPRSPTDDATVKKLKKKSDEILARTWQHFYAQAVISDSLYTKAKKEGTTDPNPNTHLTAALNSLDLAIMVVPEKWNAYGFKAQMLGKLDSAAASAENWGLALKAIEAVDKSKLDDDQRKEYEQGASIAREALLIAYYRMDRYKDVLAISNDILKADANNVNAAQLKMEASRQLSEDTTLTSEQRKEMAKETIVAARNMAKIADDIMKKSANDKDAADAMKDAIQMKAQALAEMARDTSLSEADRTKLKSDAVAALRKVLEARPKDPDVIYTLGQFNLQLGDTTAAIASFIDYLKIDATTAKDRAVNFALGVLYLERGSHPDLEKARDTFKYLTELYPNDGAAWINYGVTLVRLGDTKNGSDYIKKGQALGGVK